MLTKKHCVFCTELVGMERDGEYERYFGCMCAPQGHYKVKSDAIAALQSFPYEKKRRVLPLLSAYIRELDEHGERASLTLEQAEAIVSSPEVATTMEQKGRRLLRYLYRNSNSAGDPVNLHPLARAYNVAYASNLQELVYLIEKARDSGWIDREGAVLKLTESGWAEAMAESGAGRRKECCVLAGSEQIYTQWSAILPNGLEQCGYGVRMFHPNKIREIAREALQEAAAAGSDGRSEMVERMTSCKLIIVDVTEADPETYFAAGFAARAGVPILWTIKREASGDAAGQPSWLRPLPWDMPEQLIELLQERV
ncbi:hypothetical protein PAT3040_00527 [Paenibacillus agaridevorans]|uniref:Uncharacterized protein n=1 Tax=Paenibacillus agaridevorans TaxID=171404 RepID=A0A2R5ERL8_9BACL|nr:hypothetical protein [Paenibacillus agaridevorans]GBG06034.1 hypothetical protein PAT3040_00527 [Paenibacillus agaridevorans]